MWRKESLSEFFKPVSEITTYFNQRFHLCHRPPWICTSMPFGVMTAQAITAQEAAAEETRKAEASEITCQTQAEPDSMSHQDVAMKTDSLKMTDVESGVANFASSARAGRRNALPDIQSSAATDGTSDLPLKLEALSVKEDAKEKDEETTQDQLEKPQNEEK
ncbi:cAMP-dependent protein kinase inhibitor beta isoform X1 [Nomascus leucogenys]|nr:cAMP-dependent protein kinase inhibitor beta isoform X1 [Nomascus leucogenys]XP_032013890.1 cAMP-dependent protein kinase inhibitor beta isoform X1 [Hylobates moloch]XP_032013900.1 cAMP-dependent protein kinase inhibitor beta isoform X1 [Hylobates moloch]XP_058291518.1 cAMP-dependent protein kinase inhibitor beta isoform X1 [Hylobates moloch]